MMVTPTVVEQGPHQVSGSIVVDASASTLFDILVHPSRHHETDGSGTVGPASGGGDRLEQCGAFTVRMRALGIPYSITSTVTEMVPDRVVEWRHPSGHRWRYEFDPVNSSRTQVTETWDYRETRARRAHEFLAFPRRNARGIEQALVRLAEQFGR